MQLCFVLSTDTDPEAVGVSERKQRLHVYDRFSQGDLHVRWFVDRERVPAQERGALFRRAAARCAPKAFHALLG